jgi:hypothetical protein
LFKWSVRVTIKFSELDTAHKLNEATYADSSVVPKGMLYKQCVYNSSLVFECSGDQPERVRSTIDEVLEQLELVIRIMNS